MKKALALALGAIISTQAMAAEIKPDHPFEYTVEKGDTLWDIASQFLKDPWEWEELWDMNDQIKDPHRIFPGDVIYFTYQDGVPVLSKTSSVNGEQPNITTVNGKKVMKLSPKVRMQAAVIDPIPGIPMEKIKPFINEMHFLSMEEYHAAGTILQPVGSQLLAAKGDEVYLIDIDKSIDRFDVIEEHEIITEDTKTTFSMSKKPVSVESIKIGEVRVLRHDKDVAIAEIMWSNKSLKKGLKVIPHEDREMAKSLYPKVADVRVTGQIKKIVNGVRNVGAYQMVRIDLLSTQGIKVGDVVSILDEQKVIQDKENDRTIELPLTSKAVGIVVDAGENSSYVLILEASNTISVGDKVTTDMSY